MVSANLRILPTPYILYSLILYEAGARFGNRNVIRNPVEYHTLG